MSGKGCKKENANRQHRITAQVRRVVHLVVIFLYDTQLKSCKKLCVSVLKQLHGYLDYNRYLAIIPTKIS